MYYKTASQYFEENSQEKPYYQTDMYYKTASQYFEDDSQEQINNEEERKDDYLICDVSCNDIYNCI